VKLLLEEGAELKSNSTKYGRTPLLWAPGFGHKAVVNLLLEKAPS
jgi:ankyrin repeat protein